MQVNEVSGGSFYEYYLELARQRSQEAGSGVNAASTKNFENMISKAEGTAPPPPASAANAVSQSEATAAGEKTGYSSGRPPPPPTAAGEDEESDSSALLNLLQSDGGGRVGASQGESGGGAGFYAELLRTAGSAADNDGLGSDFTRYMRGLVKSAYGA